MNTVRGFHLMYFIQMNELESDVTLACLLWRIIDFTEVTYFKLENHTSDTKMKIKYTQGMIPAEIEIDIVKKLILNDNEYEIGFLDDNAFLYEKEEVV